MFNQFSKDHKNAVHYAKVASLLMFEFGLDASKVPCRDGLDLVSTCGQLREQGHSVETSAVICLISLAETIRHFPELTEDVQIDCMRSIEKTLRLVQASKILPPLFEIALQALTSLDVFLDNWPEVRQLHERAEAGDSEAQIQLGNMCSEGDVVPKDFSQAAEWYRRAALNGNPTAQRLIGGCYLGGTGLDCDEKEARKWFQKAAEQGDSLSQCFVGLCYYQGDGVQKNLVAAAKWFGKAAKQGNEEALELLEKCLEDKTVLESLEAETELLRNEAELGDAEAQLLLGNAYCKGAGMGVNKTEGAKWHRKAADQGHAVAQFIIGMSYRFGEGVVVDYLESAKWLRKSADQQHSPAQYALGSCYSEGLGVEKSEVQALHWFRKAAELGHTGALEILAQ